MVKASKKAVCIFVDCAWGAKHADLTQKYRVTGFPTVIYADCEGEEVGRMEERTPEAMAGELTELVKDHPTSLR